MASKVDEHYVLWLRVVFRLIKPRRALSVVAGQEYRSELPTAKLAVHHFLFVVFVA